MAKVLISSSNKFPDYSKVKRFVDDETYHNWFRSGHPQIGDVLIITVGNSIGRVSIMGENRGVITQNLIGMRFKDSSKPGFYYYYLSQKKVQHYLSGLDIGSAQPSLKVPHLLNTEIPCPSLKEQQAITAVLASLDDKIDLLHRQNKTLEALAQTLFRHWFIDGAEDDWEERSLYDAIDLVGGGTPKTSVESYWNGDIYWLSGGDIASNHKSFVVSSEKSITEVGLNNSSAKLLPKHSTVISAR
ncbi:MAG: restriction endonuclease subunit S, partial [Anaerolineales bacterium]|nr:restriction endonuclease subunit S [Anaerolineales bacterium]